MYLFHHTHGFAEHFVVVPADMPELVEQAYRLRHQVYCVEHAFEDPAVHRNGIETDEYDDRSKHAVLIHRSSGCVCGCVRLILPEARRPLPMMRFVDPGLREQLAILSASGLAEVSRYAISKSFRRRADENQHPDINFFSHREEDRRMLPAMTLGLMLGVARLSVNHGIKYLSAVMAPSLIRLLRQFGMEFTALGSLVEYHGLRQPCIASVDELLNGVRQRRPEYFELVSAGCSSSDASSSWPHPRHREAVIADKHANWPCSTRVQL